MKRNITEGKIKGNELNQNNKDSQSNISLKGSSKTFFKDNKINNENKLKQNKEIKKPNFDEKEMISKERDKTTKEEIITGIIKGKTKNKNDDLEKLSIDSKKGTKVDIIRSNIPSEKDEDKKNIKTESITGSIIGTPRQKNIVEYGSTKGYKRPNIKKGKDFIHNPTILIEGTINGIKNIPRTLKWIFEDKVNG